MDPNSFESSVSLTEHDPLSAQSEQLNVEQLCRDDINVPTLVPQSQLVSESIHNQNAVSL